MTSASARSSGSGFSLFKLITIALMAAVGFGQTQDFAATAARPEFDVASIRSTSPDDGQTHVRLLWLPGGRFSATGITAKMLIGVAYSVKPFQIFGGPSWIGRDQYSIDAKGTAKEKGSILSLYLTPQQRESEEGNLRLQSLLVERFQLRAHRETKEQEVYSLVIGKNGPKFKESKFDDSAAEKGLQGLKMHPYELTGTKVSIHYLVEELSRRLSRNVVDQTGLNGEYDFDLGWAPDAGDGDSLPNGPSIFTALQEQLGLKLESSKAPVDVLVIDHIEKPSAN
jgi:uncharacterized protein (TIGR03435 family)